MQDWQETPLSFGEILDVTFRILRQNFAKLFLLMLILVGPVYLLQVIGLISGGMSFLPGSTAQVGLTSLLEGFTQSQGPSLGIPYFVLVLISSLLLIFISLPVSYTSLILAVDQIREEGIVILPTIIRQAFSRYWPLLGGTAVYGLLGFALYIGIILIITVYLAVGIGFGSLSGLQSGIPPGLGLHILVIILLSIAGICGLIYLMTRWGFYFAATVFEPVSPGIGKSWSLTRNYFWRLFGLYFVVAIINLIISVVLQMAIKFLLGGSVLAFLLTSLVSILVMIMPVIAYAVTYFDLRVRNEGTDLQALLENYQD